jgi:cell division protein FtsL
MANLSMANLSMDRVVLPDLGNRRGVGVWAFLLALLTAGALAHVAVRMHGIQIAYDLGRERRTNTELEEQRRRLNIEIGMLKDPGRVIGIARDTLGMGPPAASDVVRLGPGVVLPLEGRR